MRVHAHQSIARYLPPPRSQTCSNMCSVSKTHRGDSAGLHQVSAVSLIDDIDNSLRHPVSLINFTSRLSVQVRRIRTASALSVTECFSGLFSAIHHFHRQHGNGSLPPAWTSFSFIIIIRKYRPYQ